MLDRNDQHYYEYVSIENQIPQYDGILLNTWEDLDSTTLKAFEENEIWRSMVKIPVLAQQITELWRWDAFGSIIFVSFGSGGMLSAQQITKLVIGLELSEQRFIWVVRPPMKGAADESFFTIKIADSDDTLHYLLEGFLTRSGVRWGAMGWGG
ncbi:anthocyanidin 3-O-glucosyltransferase 5-like [Olea europaea var. sylvestris]|uniref:anthocyanidin 3-O-glucosyltransferase 5-like n=1 Tax=Olea europaea var. sylvestris TaxID=158386 RepID=UPI000C1D3055|nr:anthocyanidin 3-O-glucosyltransferase 5-like [Olea europaea var. sylvestris]